ncbi:MAG TPA: hypothetical protein VIG88_04155 [Lysobacter sp.]
MKSMLLVACLMLVAMPVALASQSTDAVTAPAATDGAPAPAQAPVDGAASGKKKICTRERPMGSNRVQKVCRLVDEREADAARDAMGELMRGGAARPSGDGP